MNHVNDRVLEDVKLRLARKALHVIDAAYTNALSVMTEISSPELFFRADYRVLDAVLYLATIGMNGQSIPDLELDHRLTEIEWDSLLIHALGQSLLSLSKEFQNAKPF